MLMDGYTYTGAPDECSRCWPHKAHGDLCRECQTNNLGCQTEEYKDLYEVISFEGFSFASWRQGESDVLQPRLEALGYTDIKWFMGEHDSFGPLTRICHAKKDGVLEKLTYG